MNSTCESLEFLSFNPWLVIYMYTHLQYQCSIDWHFSSLISFMRRSSIDILMLKVDSFLVKCVVNIEPYVHILQMF